MQVASVIAELHKTLDLGVLEKFKKIHWKLGIDNCAENSRKSAV